VNPNLSVPELKELLASSSEKIGSGYDAKGFSKKFGFGRINAAQAVQAAREKL
jgi:hypothetical protein